MPWWWGKVEQRVREVGFSVSGSAVMRGMELMAQLCDCGCGFFRHEGGVYVHDCPHVDIAIWHDGAVAGMRWKVTRH